MNYNKFLRRVFMLNIFYLRLVFFLIIYFYSLNSFTQKCELNGHVSFPDKNPVPYANVVLKSNIDSTIVLGTITNEKGEFKINDIYSGNYFLSVFYLGYSTYELSNININKEKQFIDTIQIDIRNQHLKEVTVSGKRPIVSYMVDKKVIDASNTIGASFAIDLLESVPSIETDFEGNITYRDGGLFIVYIDGKPIANGVQMLQQLPVNKIDNIEVITNPSAQFSADGTAGVINVILKEQLFQGYKLTSSAFGSSLGSYGGQFYLSKKAERIEWYIEGSLSNRIFNVHTKELVMKTYQSDSLYLVNSRLKAENRNLQNYLSTGLDYNFNRNNISISLYSNIYDCSELKRVNGKTKEQLFLDNLIVNQQSYNLEGVRDSRYRYWGSTFSYNHSFDSISTNKLNIYITYSNYLSPYENEVKDKKEYSHLSETFGKKTTQKNKQVTELKFDYTNKFLDLFSYHSGFSLSYYGIPIIKTLNGEYYYNHIEEIYQLPVNQEVEYDQSVCAVYLMLKGEHRKLTYQLGIRGEYAYRKFEYSYSTLPNFGQTKKKSLNEQLDFFPSFHTLYNFSKKHQIGFNISRRVERPKYWSIVPTASYSSPYSYYIGNEGLDPSHLFVAELFYKKSWNDNFIGFELFSRRNFNIIQTIIEIDTANISRITPENVGKSLSNGSELMANFQILKWWDVNLSFDFYFYKLIVNSHINNDVKEQIRNDARINSLFRLPKKLSLKIDFIYKSPSVTAQSKRESYFYSNVALEKRLYNNWVVSIVYTDIFYSKNYKSISQGYFFENHTKYNYQPYIYFKLSYFLDNQK